MSDHKGGSRNKGSIERDEANRRVAIRTEAQAADGIVETLTLDEFKNKIEPTALRRLERAVPHAFRRNSAQGTEEPE